jgi:hypothetical protein
MGKKIEEISKSRSDFEFDSSRQMIPCFAHILNIVFQDMLNKGLKSSSPDANDNDIYAIKQSLEEQDQQPTTENKRSPINKVRRGCIKIKYVQVKYV